MPIAPTNPSKARQYPDEVILLAVRWYLRYPFAYLHISEILSERGLSIDASCIGRWVQAYAPELDKRCRPHLKTTNKSYRVDETYVKVKGKDRYLYRAVDSTGQTIGCLGGIAMHMCTWSTIRCPSTIWHSFCLASAWKIGPS
jgi:transposase-like protein